MSPTDISGLPNTVMVIIFALFTTLPLIHSAKDLTSFWFWSQDDWNITGSVFEYSAAGDVVYSISPENPISYPNIDNWFTPLSDSGTDMELLFKTKTSDLKLSFVSARIFVSLFAPVVHFTGIDGGFPKIIFSFLIYFFT